MERKGKGEGKGMKAYHDETHNLPSVYMFLELFEVVELMSTEVCGIADGNQMRIKLCVVFLV